MPNRTLKFTSAILFCSALCGGEPFQDNPTVDKSTLPDGAKARLCLSNAEESVLTLAISPDGKVLVAGSSSGSLYVWEIASRRLVRSLRADSGSVCSVAFSPKGDLLALGTREGSIHIWNTASFERVKSYKVHDRMVDDIKFSPDGKAVASSSSDYTAALCNLNTPKAESLRFKGHENVINGVVVSPDGMRLYTGSADASIRVWNAKDAALETSVTAHERGITSLAISPDGALLASGAQDGLIRIWDARTLDRLASLDAHSSIVDGLSFSHDGRFLASASWDGTIRLWEVASTCQLHVWRTPGIEHRAVDFSPDGEVLASAESNGTVTLWSVYPEMDPRQQRERDVSLDEMKRSWDALGSVDGGAVRNAFRVLSKGGDEAVNFLRDRLSSVSKEELWTFVEALDDDDPVLRASAAQSLANHGLQAKPLLEAELRKRISTDKAETIRRILEAIRCLFPVRSPDILRRLRITYVLETIGSPRARQVLAEMALSECIPERKAAESAVLRMKGDDR
jgi:WD40 repeat protein